ncbi:MAG: phage tail sheath family protein [Massilia sp.]
MPEYLTPGVYIEEIERGPRPIEGVPTSTSAFLGETERGPIRPRLVTSYKDFQRWFGGVFGNGKYMPYAVSGFFENGGRRLFVSRIVPPKSTPASTTIGTYLVRAVGAGAWGKRVWVRIDDSSTLKRDGADLKPVGFRLRLAYWNTLPADAHPFDPFTEAGKATLPRPVLVEDFDDLVIDESSPDYFAKRLLDSSALATVERAADADPAVSHTKGSQVMDKDGDEDATALTPADYEGLPAEKRLQEQGLAILEQDPYRDVSLIYAPAVSTDVAKKIVSHCEKLRFRFAAIDSEATVGDLSKLEPRSLVTDTQYAAFYFPWIYVSDPQTGARKLVPPGGHALGVYARTDSERGVFKAPANEILRGALELAVDINDSQQGLLNPKGVNVTRSFPGRGIRVWGVRTLSSNALWKYVSVRRLFIFLERSIYEGTQWVVFEPNDPRLWARVTDTVTLFLRTQYRLGALFGRTEAQAFFITCNESTMTQDDIMNGRLICEIGIAPVRPAEFVIFRIFQNTAEAQR